MATYGMSEGYDTSTGLYVIVRHDYVLPSQ